MICNKLFETVDSLYDEYITVWDDVCKIESPTTYKQGVDKVGNYFIELAKKQGWQIEVCEQAVSGNAVCITMNPCAKKAPICLSGHMDTVFPVGMFADPIVYRDAEKIYGPGVRDCKGGIVAGFLAMDVLQKCGFKTRPIKMLLQSDEENSSRFSNKATINYICDQAKNAEAFFNLEGYRPGSACLVRKGIVNYVFDVRGIEAHSSTCAERGANAICEAAHKIIELEKLKDTKGVTCNCGVIKGGSVSNTVAGRCEFTANIRFATKEQREWVDEYVKRVAETVHVNGCTCLLSIQSERVAMEKCERNVRLLEKINGIFEQNGLPRLDQGSSNGGSDAADVTTYGIPCIDSLGVYGGFIHSKDEFATLESLKESAKRLVAIINCL